MKKTLLLLAIASLGVTSCKKDRVCECTTTFTLTNPNFTFSDTQVDEFTFTKTSKRTAKLACVHRKGTEVNNGTTQTYDMNCKLK